MRQKYEKTFIALGQPDSTVGSSAQQDVADCILIDLYILIEPIYLVMVGWHLTLDAILKVLPESFGLGFILL